MKILFVSLGCDKNLVDTENMLGILKNKGFEFTDDEWEADIIAINTCCFIGDAKQESINTILEMAEHKKDARCKVLVVAGCLAHRYQDEIIKELPEVVLATLQKDYADYTFKAAAVKTDEHGAKTYKVVIVNEEGTESEVIFNEQGEVLK